MSTIAPSTVELIGTLQDDLTELRNRVSLLASENARLREERYDNRPKLSPGDVRTMRGMFRDGTTQAQIADMYDVNPATVSRIVRDLYWK